MRIKQLVYTRECSKCRRKRKKNMIYSGSALSLYDRFLPRLPFKQHDQQSSNRTAYKYRIEIGDFVSDARARKTFTVRAKSKRER